jgi:hypothetical protein
MTRRQGMWLIVAAVVIALGILLNATVGVGVKDYGEFRSAVNAGASCSELIDIKNGFEGRERARMERDLREIGCTSTATSRTDR